MQGIHPSPVNSPHKDQCHGALMFPLICTWPNGWVNNRDASDFLCHRAHYDVTVMIQMIFLEMSGSSCWEMIWNYYNEWIIKWTCIIWSLYCATKQMDCINYTRQSIWYYKTSDIRHKNPKLKWFSSHLAVVFFPNHWTRCLVENEDVVGVAPTGDAPTTSEWSTSLFPTKVWLILDVWRCISYV